jgi:hypothetical protein
MNWWLADLGRRSQRRWSAGAVLLGVDPAVVRELAATVEPYLRGDGTYPESTEARWLVEGGALLSSLSLEEWLDEQDGGVVGHALVTLAWPGGARDEVQSGPEREDAQW